MRLLSAAHIREKDPLDVYVTILKFNTVTLRLGDLLPYIMNMGPLEEKDFYLVFVMPVRLDCYL